MTNKTTLQMKAEHSRRLYQELLRMDAQGGMIGARILSRAKKTWKIRAASAAGKGLEL